MASPNNTPPVVTVPAPPFRTLAVVKADIQKKEEEIAEFMNRMDEQYADYSDWPADANAHCEVLVNDFLKLELEQTYYSFGGLIKD